MPSPVNPLSFFHGAASLPRAWSFIWQHKRLWPLAAAPFFLNLAVFVLAFWLSYVYLGDWVRGLMPTGEGWWWAALLYVLLVLVVLALLALEVYLFAVVGRIVAEPFLDLLDPAHRGPGPGHAAGRGLGRQRADARCAQGDPARASRAS